MRQLILLLLIVFSLDGFNTVSAAIQEDSESYKIIGDSVFMQDGSICHVDNFADGKCDTNESWWDINYLSFWIGLLLPFVFFSYIAITIKRKLNKRGK